MYAGAKAFFYALSRSAALKKLASTYGMSTSGGFARRFIAGETIDEAIDTSRRLQAQAFLLTLDYLGESVRTLDKAASATREYVQLMDLIVASEIERNLSLKLTQLGVDVDRATCVDNLRRIVDPAAHHGFFVRLDMENSPYTDVTLEVFETLWQLQYWNLGVALQAPLYRAEADIRRMNDLGARVRLVKGAYKEPASVAHQKKADVNQAFVRLAQLLLDEGTYPAIATRDPDAIEPTRAYARSRGIASDRYEFQILYGVRRDLQTAIVAAGERMQSTCPSAANGFRTSYGAWANAPPTSPSS